MFLSCIDFIIAFLSRIPWAGGESIWFFIYFPFINQRFIGLLFDSMPQAVSGNTSKPGRVAQIAFFTDRFENRGLDEHAGVSSLPRHRRPAAHLPVYGGPPSMREL